jgi:hypothetical protein
MSRNAAPSRTRTSDSGPPEATGPSEAGRTDGPGPPVPVPSPGSGTSAAVRQLATLATNAAVLTALLVYFGWRRAETQAARLGVDETILGLTTTDYLLRSVGPVLQLLATVAVAGLVAVRVDRALRRRMDRRGGADPVVRAALVVLSFAWLGLPLLVIALGYLAPAVAFVAFPLSIGAGIVLLVYGSGLRRRLAGAEPEPSARRGTERTAVAIAIAVTLFWATSNYAEVIGNQVADDVIAHVGDLTPVTVYSPDRLGIASTGTSETTVQGDGQAYRYRYSGLRLLEHASGRYFLIPDGWAPGSSVIIMLSDGAPLRFEFGLEPTS